MVVEEIFSSSKLWRLKFAEDNAFFYTIVADLPGFGVGVGWIAGGAAVGEFAGVGGGVGSDVFACFYVGVGDADDIWGGFVDVSKASGEAGEAGFVSGGSGVFCDAECGVILAGCCGAVGERAAGECVADGAFGGVGVVAVGVGCDFCVGDLAACAGEVNG